MVNKKYLVEDVHREKVEEILQVEGFRNVTMMPRLCLYDYEAEKDGHRAYVEVKTRSVGYAPIFVLKESKLRRLKELKASTGREVYLLLLQGSKYKLFEIDNPPDDLKPFKLSIIKGVKAFRFPTRGELTDEEKKRIVELRKAGFPVVKIALELGRSEPAVRKSLPQELRGVLVTRPKKPKTKYKALRIPYKRDDTCELWRELLYEYKKFGKKAEDLLVDSLKYFKQWGMRKGKVH